MSSKWAKVLLISSIGVATVLASSAIVFAVVRQKTSQTVNLITDSPVDITNKNKNQNKIPLSSDNINDVPIKLIDYEYSSKNFLGTKGLKLLNEMIKEKLPYSSEVCALQSISFNNELALPDSVSSINGSYNSVTMEINIDTRDLMLKSACLDASLITDEELQARVYYVYSVILHEYGHHIANIYASSIRYDDSQNYNQSIDAKQRLVCKSTSSIDYYENVPSVFMTNWMSALNYSNKNQNILSAFSASPYSKYTAKQYFEIFNVISNSDYSSLIKNYYTTFYVPTFNYNSSGSPMYELSYSNLSYYYSFQELFTRELSMLNYLNPNYNFYYNYFGTLITPSNVSNAPSIDVSLRNQAVNSSSGFNVNSIYAADNIYGGTIQGINQNIEVNNNSQDLYNAYSEVMGYGKLISQIYMDDSEQYSKVDGNYYVVNKLPSSSFNEIKIGGFIHKNSNIKSLLLWKSDNDYTQINLHQINSPGLSGKSSLFATTYAYTNNEYVSYISDEIDMSTIDFERTQIKYWDDENQDGIIQSSEIKSINNDQIASTRPITTFRSKFKVWGVNGKTYFYEDKVGVNVWDINWVSSNNSLVFKKSIN